MLSEEELETVLDALDTQKHQLEGWLRLRHTTDAEIALARVRLHQLCTARSAVLRLRTDQRRERSIALRR